MSLAAVLCGLVSCNKTGLDPDATEPTGFYVLNNGSWGGNDASVSRFDITDKTCSPNAFLAANNRALGDLGQDMIRFQNYLVFAVNGSKKVFITDESLKIKVEISFDYSGLGELSPRYLCCTDKKIYVSLYEGYVCEINPADLSKRYAKVGPNPEGIAVCNGKLFVANSGGYNYPEYNNTVSVVDIESFKEEKTLTVNCNPNLMARNGNHIYLTSFGNYADIPAKLQHIDALSLEVSDLDYKNPSYIALEDSKLYVLCGGYDADWNPLPGTVLVHDAAANKALGGLMKDGTNFPMAYSLSACGGYVWVGCSDYKTNGDVYVVDAIAGSLYHKFDCKGLNPIKVLR